MELRTPPNYILNLPEQHPVCLYIEETSYFQQLMLEICNIQFQDDTLKFKNLFRQISEIEMRFVRKENQLFPFLEKRGWDGPSKGMWMFHDSIRQQFKEAFQAFEKENFEDIPFIVQALIEDLRRLMLIEENKLFPISLQILKDEDWEKMENGNRDVGWAHVKKTQKLPIRFESEPKLGFLNLEVGILTSDQIQMVLGHLPLDITYVDEKDEVRYFNRSEERIFPRSSGVIGRQVKYCHPPKSVATVLTILEEFKSGTQNTAEFWIDYKGRKIHIRYFAVRDREGRYRGVLESSQDITEIQKISGQRRLLEWGPVSHG